MERIEPLHHHSPSFLVGRLLEVVYARLDVLDFPHLGEDLESLADLCSVLGQLVVNASNRLYHLFEEVSHSTRAAFSGHMLIHLEGHVLKRATSALRFLQHLSHDLRQ